MYLTHFGANSWLLELPEQRILIDPWLVGSLVFGNQPWFFKGDKPEALNSIPDKIDLILLSQGLEDHAHTPTLEKLDKTIPVVASTSATKVVKQLGYTQVTTLTAGESVPLGDHIEIRALPGAPIGPFQQENAYLIKQLDSGKSLYYEPHGYPPAEVKDYAPVDIVISPAVTLELPLLGPVIQGHKTALQLAQWLQPQVFLPTAADEIVEYQGVLASVLREVGSLEELRSQLLQQNLPTKVITPKVGVSLEL
ncbi:MULTISPECIES: MBL fold metallo-hydrolase [Moorena]|uniref:Zn-dependent hydrolase n=1 Tax=Moorena bouillonii PNG TaxID=568701 RepID=A0A1U7MVK4_9CYAN|nr:MULTISPECIES: MBL fold metallo-hydrolase [Moorena]NEO04413.1 MBL fold metallo-hydrolase [Moorena sp. SIO3I8]OLT55941.1 Zn-dependent hydrolase [Moorena bouillonii PNG]